VLQELAALKSDIDKGLADVAAGRVKDFGRGRSRRNLDLHRCTRQPASWRLAAGGWRLAAGGWRLAAGGWRGKYFFS
jgi:hypothetical protein